VQHSSLIVIDATQGTFSRDVIEASQRTPVLVDFWAPWCGPCRVLGPMLEKLEAEYVGRLRLVKINSDECPELAARFRVRSIPYVVAFSDGKPIDSFVGVLPENQLRAFIERLLPNPCDLQRRKAARLQSEGDFPGAAAALRAAVALAPDNDAARLDLAALLLDHSTVLGAGSAVDEAQALLVATSKTAGREPPWQALHTKLESLKRIAELPPAETLRARIDADGNDLAARLDLASLHIANRDFEPALEQLLAIVERDRSFRDDVGRRTILAVFELAAGEPHLVAAFRRRLSAALNR